MTTTPKRDPLAFLDDEVAALRERHLYRALRVMSSAQGPIVSVDGERVVSLSSNDYLGLTHHPRLREAAVQAALKARFSPTKLSGQPVKVSGTINYKFALVP